MSEVKTAQEKRQQKQRGHTKKKYIDEQLHDYKERIKLNYFSI